MELPFFDKKNIEVIGLSKNISQIKYAGEILSKLPKLQNTAMVLSDETLLPITLSSLPKNVDAINITMGYPLKDIPSTGLCTVFSIIFIARKTSEKSRKQFLSQRCHSFYKGTRDLQIASKRQPFGCR